VTFARLVVALALLGPLPSPLYGEDFPDPVVVTSGAFHYAFATNGSGGNVQVIRSLDLRQWAKRPDALPQLPSWASKGSTWAPAVLERSGRWVLFFTARHRTSGRQCIGRATAASIDGPFTDTSPQPIVCQLDRGGSIDPATFVDPADGAAYLLYKSEGVEGREPTRLWSQRLSADGTDVVGDPVQMAVTDQAWEGPIVEGPAMVAAAGSYWLLYAGNHWETADYGIGYARCAAPLGPCTKWGGGPLLSSGGAIAGPGAPGVVADPDGGGGLLLTFHAWASDAVGYGHGGRRTLRAVPLRFEAGRALVGEQVAPAPSGYRLVAADGGVFAFGRAGYHGSTGDRVLNRPIVAGAPTRSGEGYWMAASDGGVFAFGDAAFLGSTGDRALNRPIVGMAATPTGRGYWLVASDGGVFAFGDAAFLGSTGGRVLNRPIVGMAATPTGRGYWLTASDGGVFAFGDATYFGSTGGMALGAPITTMMATPWGDGYWLVGADGGVFSFGRAPFFGSTGALRLRAPIVAATASPTGGGYWFTASDGGVFAFGDAPFHGSTGDRTLNSPVVTMA
jgi:hypothetical protein